jgi:hypothetical protein
MMIGYLIILGIAVLVWKYFDYTSKRMKEKICSLFNGYLILGTDIWMESEFDSFFSRLQKYVTVRRTPPLTASIKKSRRRRGPGLC